MSYFASAMFLKLVRFIRGGASADDSTSYGDEVAKPDGMPLWIGYGNVRVSSPDQIHTVTWTYIDEQRFGDSVNVVSLDGETLPGYYWGRGHAWSPNSDYFTLERRAEVSSLYVVRASDRRWTKVADRSSPISFVYPSLTHQTYDEPVHHKHLELLGSQVWTSIHDD